MTIFTLPMSLPTSFSAFSSAATTTIPVPCWSLSKTGIGEAAAKSDSTEKHLGAVTS